MRIKLSRARVLDLRNSLSSVDNLGGNIKFSYAISRTALSIEPETMLIRRDIEEGDKMRLKLCGEMSVKNDDGSPKLKDNGTAFEISDTVTFNARIQEIQNELREKLSIETEIDVFAVKLTEVPISITPSQLKGLLPMITNEEYQDLAKCATP